MAPSNIVEVPEANPKPPGKVKAILTRGLLSVSNLFDDYFPKRVETNLSGIHAKLNYQVIADWQTRRMSFLMLGIVILSITFMFSIWYLSKEHDTIISSSDLEKYDEWMSKVEHHTGGAPEIEEENTKMYWSVYFFRYITVRLFIAVTYGVILAFLIKVYLRTRRDRSANIQKEEALSTLHYFARGEWRYRYDDKGQVVRNEDGTALTLDLTEDSNFTTREIFENLDMRQLFSIPDEEKRRGKRKASNDDQGDLVEKISKVSNTLTEISQQMGDILSSQK